MPVPAAYTEDELAAYMHDTLGEVAASLGYSAPASYTEAVNEVLLYYGVDDIAQVTGRENIRRLRALAKVQAWQKVVNDTAGDFDFSDEGSRFNRSQVHTQATLNLRAAQAEARPFDPAYRITTGRLNHVHDPYQYRPDEERGL